MLNSKELYERIEKLRIKRGLTVSQLNEQSGISHATLNSWKKRGTMPKLEILESICFALNYPLAALLYDVDLDDLSGEEIELLSLWNSLDDEQKTAIRSTLKAMKK